MHLITVLLFISAVSANPLVRNFADEDSNLSANFPADDDPRWRSHLPRSMKIRSSITEDGIEYICESGEFAPATEDVLATAKKLIAKNSNCQQLNGVESHCTRMTDKGTASVACCGRFLAYRSCPSVGGAIQNIVAFCQSNGHTGGYVKFSNNYKVSVYHS